MCVIVYTEINGKKILAKNRDKVYKPVVEIRHEIVNGIEVAYIRDKISGWIEGMNEEGIALVNSTLSSSDGKRREKPKMLVKKNNVMYNALVKHHDNNNFFDVIQSAKGDYVLEGHSLLMKDGDVFHIENNKENDYIIEKINNKKRVYSNYGVRLKHEGLTKCVQGESAYLRAKIVEDELKRSNIQSIDDLVNRMNTNYSNVDPRFHPYRDKYVSRKVNKKIDPEKIIVSTTGQIVFNITDKEFTYYTDINNSRKVEYVNKLPREYLPKIRIIIKETEKRVKSKKRIFTKKFLKNVGEKYECSKNKSNSHKKTRKNR
jgi:hypothetical protein